MLRGWTEASASCWLSWSQENMVLFDGKQGPASCWLFSVVVAFPKNHPGGLPVMPFEKRGKPWETGKKICGLDFFEDPRIIIKWSVCKRPARNEWLHEGVGATCKVLTNNKTAGVLRQYVDSPMDSRVLCWS